MRKAGERECHFPWRSCVKEEEDGSRQSFPTPVMRCLPINDDNAVLQRVSHDRFAYFRLSVDYHPILPSFRYLAPKVLS